MDRQTTRQRPEQGQRQRQTIRGKQVLQKVRENRERCETKSQRSEVRNRNAKMYLGEALNPRRNYFPLTDITL